MLGWCLVTSDEAYRLSFQKLRVHKQQFGAILRVGLPAGIQNCVFSMSNVIIQSSINSFGSVVIAGNSAAGNIEGFIYTAMNSIHHATVTATAQNMGAKQEKRVYQSLRVNIMLVIVVGLVLGILVVLFREPLLGIYSSDPAVIAAGARRNLVIGSTYFLCGMMEVYVGHLRGMGYSIVPTVVSIIGVCGVRIGWIYTVFAAHRSVDTLYAAWTVSWLATAAIHYICILFVRRRANCKSNGGPAIKIVLQRKPNAIMVNNEMIRKGGRPNPMRKRNGIYKDFVYFYGCGADAPGLSRICRGVGILTATDGSNFLSQSTDGITALTAPGAEVVIEGLPARPVTRLRFGCGARRSLLTSCMPTS